MRAALRLAALVALAAGAAGALACGTRGRAGAELDAGDGDAAAAGADAAVEASTGCSVLDCANPACSAACVTVPVGWRGPVAVETDTAGPLHFCAAPFAELVADLRSGLQASAPSCACACSLSGGCGAASAALTGFTGVACNNGACTSDLSPTPGACTPLKGNPDFSCALSIQAGSVSAADGTQRCQPSLTKIAQAAGGTTTARVCGPASASAPGCKAGGVCAPTAAASGALCLAHDGDVACPAGVFRNKLVLYPKELTDTRDCTPCSCGEPPQACALVGYQDTGCAQKDGHVLGDAGACAPIPAAVRLEPHGECPADGGVPTGAVTTGAPTTMCCAA